MFVTRLVVRIKAWMLAAPIEKSKELVGRALVEHLIKLRKSAFGPPSSTIQTQSRAKKTNKPILLVKVGHMPRIHAVNIVTDST
jgi:hypothetical protein